MVHSVWRTEGTYLPPEFEFGEHKLSLETQFSASAFEAGGA